MSTEKIALLIVFCMVFSLVLPITGSAELKFQRYTGNEIIIKFKTSSMPFSFMSYESNSFGEMEKVFKVKVPKGFEVQSFLSYLRNNFDIEYAEPNYIYTISEVPNDEHYSLQWSHTASNSELGWDITTGSSDVVIAIIDTGVQWDHPDLAANIWDNVDEDCDNSTDLDGNGYYGDCRGYDFVDLDVSYYTGLGYYLLEGEDYNVTDNAPSDFHGHGTHCSGIASASTNNSIGISGVCWNCKIMPVRAGFAIGYGGNTYGSLEDDDIINAIVYAADNGADVISMSFGGPSSQAFEDAIEYAHSKGSILVGAAGNDDTSNPVFAYPAAFSNVIAVGSTDQNNELSSFSNYGSWVDIAAPGSNIISTKNDGYVYMSGTSMATPFIAGVVGLLRSLNSEIAYNNVKNILMSTSTAINSPVPFGKVDVYQALLYVTGDPEVTINSPDNDTVTSDDFEFVFEKVHCSWYFIDGNDAVTNCLIDNSEWSGEFSDLTDGPHSITVFANNSIGETVNESVYWIRDVEPPVVNVTSPLNITYSSASIFFSLNSDYTADMCVVDYGFGSVPMEENNTNWTHTNASMNEGIYGTSFYCNDSANNINSHHVVFSVDYCTPLWIELNSTCQINDTLETYHYDENDCYAITGFESDNNSPDNETNECDYYSPNTTNTSWSDWYDVTNCTVNDLITQERSKTEYDTEYGVCYNVTELSSDLWENVTHSEERNISCDFCEPKWVCLSYGICQEGGIQFCENIFDINFCYSETNLSSDAYSGSLSEHNRSCDYINYTLFEDEFNTMSEDVIINASDTVDMIIEIHMTSNTTGNVVEIIKYIELPVNSSHPSLSALGKYFDIILTGEIHVSSDWAIIKIYYSDYELEESGLDEESLAIYYWNEKSKEWETMNDSGINITENYVWVNVTHFSIYGVYGNLLPYCGDFSCNNGETCSSCSSDCGACPPSAPSGTGPSGGFFISSLPKVCEESWTCTEWSECTDNLKTRTCTDENDCDTSKEKPDEKRACEMPKVE
ncbi:MAG: peptidase S8, partial [Candidatus Aenigmarchaeota archaeon]|nr:peptidase S8 [Candidatus Aenigmarchaeota archaeon]